jgi:hypothetical protein
VTSDPGPESSRFVRDAQDSQSADVAITVFDDWQFGGGGKVADGRPGA